jgi:hypothetical protein
MRLSEPYGEFTLKMGIGLENPRETANLPRVEREEIEAAALAD